MQLFSCVVSPIHGFFFLNCIKMLKKLSLRVKNSGSSSGIWGGSFLKMRLLDCIKSVCIRSYSVPHFPAFGLNTERYGVSLRIQ